MSTPLSPDLKITFIGAGNMASALAGGLVSRGLNPARITLTDINEASLAQARTQLGVQTSQDNTQAVTGADVVVLAVKPQVMETVLTPLKDVMAEHKPLVISIAAGITLSRLGSWLGEDLALVRCMPNTPALVETGACGLFANNRVTDEQKTIAQQILGAVGIVEWLPDEASLDAVTALSGSGPAYFFLLMEAMINSGIEMGLDPAVARELTLQTALGAAKMAVSADTDVATLRQNVTSPGGTTAAAIGYFEDKGFADIVDGALKAAQQRSRELA